MTNAMFLLLSALLLPRDTAAVTGLPATCPKRCTKATMYQDCVDPKGIWGTLPDSTPASWPNSDCGSIDCDEANGGRCVLLAWKGDDPKCHYRICGDGTSADDGKCAGGGPGGLQSLGKVQGTCSSGKYECVYQWCPPEKVPPPSGPTRQLPAQCSTPCATDRDCIDPRGLLGAYSDSNLGAYPNSDCGSLYCDWPSGQCRLEAWVQNNTKCGHSVCDSGATKDNWKCAGGGPGGLDFVDGKCETVGTKAECVHRWCIGGQYVEVETESLIATPAMSTTMVTMAMTTQPPATTTTVAMTTTSSQLGTTEIPKCCQTNNDCVADPSDPATITRLNCGYYRCNRNQNQCEYHAWKDSKECKDAGIYIWCGENYRSPLSQKNKLCVAPPPVANNATTKGMCTLNRRSECKYAWCPTATVTTLPPATTTTTAIITAPPTTTSLSPTTVTTTISTTTTTASPGPRQLPPTCSSPCKSDLDCIDPSNVKGTLPDSSPLSWPNSDCGSLYCDAPSGQCRLVAWRNDDLRCKYKACGTGPADADDRMCAGGGPTGLNFVDGKCENNGVDCVYRWCIGGEYIVGSGGTGGTSTTTTTTITTGVVATTSSAVTGKCCQTSADCKGDVGRPLLTDCGNTRCNLALNRCEFETQLDSKAYCNDAYHVDCAGSSSKCTAGPAGSVGQCVLGGGSLCQYSWCPGVNSGGTTLPPVLPPVTGGDFWRPGAATTWDWQLKTSTLDYSRDVMVYEIDLFENSAEVIQAVKTNGGKITDPAKYRKVICYFSAGTWENWRPDQDQFPADVLGVIFFGFPDERWLDIRRMDVLAPIMKARLDMAQRKGCDAVEPDSMDVYDDTAHEASGFPLTYQDQIDYNVWLSEQAHIRGMACAFKNNGNQADVLEPYFEFVVSEQCVQYNECGKFQKFIDAGKPIFLAEYEWTLDQFCPGASKYKAMGIKKKGSLGAEFDACPPWWTDSTTV